MITNPNMMQRNPYLIKNDGTTVIFRRPLYWTFLSLILSIPMFAIGFAPSVYMGSREYVMQVIYRHDILSFIGEMGFFLLIGMPALLLATGSSLSSGASRISFDLQRRTYQRVLLAPPPVFGKRYPDTTGWGNPFKRRSITGQMSDLQGVQVVEREDKSTRNYTVYIVPKDQTVPGCVVYHSANGQDAEAQSQQIANLLGLPVLEPSLLNVFSTQPRENVSLPGDAHVASRSLGNYWIEHSEQSATFATPLRYRSMMIACGVFFCCFAAGTFALAIHVTIVPDPKVNPLTPYLEGMFWLALAAMSFTSIGLSRITFDLRNRTYERVLYRPLVIGGMTDHAGAGNIFRRANLSGTMEEIIGIDLHARPGKNSMTYTILLRWADERQPPMAVGFFADRREANERASEIAEALSLPVLETRLVG